MMGNFAVFIPTHGRPNRVKTYKTLRKGGYTGSIYLVLDDLDDTIAGYLEKYPDEILVFDKKRVAQSTDVGDVKTALNSVVFARNALFEIARDLEVDYFLVVDDDYDAFYYKFNTEFEYSEKPCRSLDAVFELMVQYLIRTPALSIAFAQNGDYLGGRRSTYGRKVFASRKCMNTFFCATDRPFKFVGRMNEDVNTYVTLGHKGHLFLTISNMSIRQTQTQASAGGNTEMYLDNGTYCKSFYTVMWEPSCAKVAVINSRNKRIHHKIDWLKAVPCILREVHKKIA